jgi:hypothetical protein
LHIPHDWLALIATHLALRKSHRPCEYADRRLDYG